MKKSTTKISILLILALIVTTLNMPFIGVNATEASDILFSEDFEGYTDDANFIETCGATFVNPTTAVVTLVDHNGGKALSLNTGTKYSTEYVKTFDEAFGTTMATEKVAVKFSIKPNATTGVITNAFIQTITGTKSSDFSIFMIDTTGAATLGGVSLDTTIPKGVWYDVVAVIDFDQSKEKSNVDIVAFCEDGKVYRKSAEINTPDRVSTLRFANYPKPSQAIEVDDICIYKNPSDIPDIVSTALPVSEDFESYELDEEGKTRKWHGVNLSYGSDYSARKAGENVLATTESGHGSKVLTYNAQYFTQVSGDKPVSPDTSYFRYITRQTTDITTDATQDTYISEGTVKYSIDVKPENTDSWKFYGGVHVEGQGKADVVPFIFFNDGKTYYNAYSVVEAKKLGDYTDGTWYHIEFTYNVETGAAFVTCSDGKNTDESGEFIFKTPQGDNIAPKRVSFLKMRFETTSASPYEYTGKVSMDNVKIEYEAGEFNVSDDSLEIYDGDTEETDKKSVSPSANKFVIDLGARVTLKSMIDAVKLSTTDGTFVDCSGFIDGSTFTLTLKDGQKLLPNTEYKLEISKDITAIDGETLGTDKVITFTTNAGEFNASLAVTNSTDVTIENLEGISTGNTIKAKISYTNTTVNNKTAKVIYAYYTGTEFEKLEKVVIDDVTLTAGVSEGTEESLHTVEDLTDVTKVQVMLWSDFITIKPLSASISLPR